MRRMKAEEIINLSSRAETYLQDSYQLYDELARYILPSRLGFREERTPGQERTKKIYDGTAPQALEDLANFLAAGLTPAASAWLQMNFREEAHNDIDHWVEWLDECVKRLTAELARSNFYESLNELYSDVPTFGIGATEISERRDSAGNWVSLHFECPWLKDLSYIPDAYGSLTTSFRRYSLAAIQWHEMFEGKAGPTVAACVVDKPEHPVEFIHAIYPRDESDIDRKGIAERPDKVDSKKLPYASVWVSKADGLIVKESGAFELPRAIVRWGTTSGAWTGYGPGHIALPDIRTVNEAKRLELLAWERNINRPMKTQEANIVGDLDMSAGGLTTVRAIDGTQPLFEATDFQLTSIKVNELQQAILRTFFADLIREPGDAGSAKTAYEVARRVERAQRILGEAVGHLRGHLRWAVERSFQIMYRAGRLPPMPDDMIEQGPNVDIRYTSPLQTSQESIALENFQMFLGDLNMMAEVQVAAGRDPEVLDWVDFDGMVREMAKRRAIPAVALRSQEEVEEIREERQERIEEAEAMAQAQAQSEVVQNVGRGAGQGAAMQLVQGGR